MGLQPKGYLSLYDLAYIHEVSEEEVLRYCQLNGNQRLKDIWKK